MSENNYDEWIENLKPGDEVCVEGLYSQRIDRVVRVTNTQIILPSDVRFCRTNGNQLGASTHSINRLYRLTDKKRERIERRSLITSLFNLDRAHLDSLPLEVLREANQLLTKRKTQ